MLAFTRRSELVAVALLSLHAPRVVPDRLLALKDSALRPSFPARPICSRAFRPCGASPALPTARPPTVSADFSLAFPARCHVGSPDRPDSFLFVGSEFGASAPFRFRLTTDTLACPSGSGHHGPQRTCTSCTQRMPGKLNPAARRSERRAAGRVRFPRAGLTARGRSLWDQLSSRSCSVFALKRPAGKPVPQSKALSPRTAKSCSAQA